MQADRKSQELWSHRSVFVLALLGSSAGLGNIWKFPYLTGEQGGGTFILVYLFCVLLVGVPIMMAEVLLGRRARSNPVQAMQQLSWEAGASSRWAWVGWLAVLNGVLIFSFYSVVAAWIFHYAFSLSAGLLVDVGAEQASLFFTGMLNNPDSLLISHSLFMLVVLLILGAGVRRGLDRAIRYLMPLLLLLLLMLLIYAYNSGYFMQAYHYLFTFHPDRVDAGMFIAALGHAFFTLSLGMGAVMTYGAYLSHKESIGQTVACVGILDTVLALLLGLVVLTVVFAAQMDPATGPGLLFITLPVAFGQLHAGQVLCVMFFLLVGITAITSVISLMEPATALLEQRLGLRRSVAALASVGGVWILSLVVLFSFSSLSGITFFAMNLFELLNVLTTYLLLPLVGLAITLFSGWVLCRRITQNELSQSVMLYYLWRFCLRYLAPLAIGLIFVTNLYNMSL